MIQLGSLLDRPASRLLQREQVPQHPPLFAIEMRLVAHQPVEGRIVAQGLTKTETRPVRHGLRLDLQGLYRLWVLGPIVFVVPRTAGRILPSRSRAWGGRQCFGTGRTAHSVPTTYD